MNKIYYIVSQHISFRVLFSLFLLICCYGCSNDKKSMPDDGFHSWLSPKGNMYIGIWHNCQLDSGTIITDKSVYVGKISNLAPDGYGIMYYNDGSVFKGEWNKGDKEGIGLWEKKDGTRRFGEWSKGLLVNGNNDSVLTTDSVMDYVLGIDLSKYQHVEVMGWDNMALFTNSEGLPYTSAYKNDKHLAPVTFVFIKSTQGDNQDPAYEKHLAEARSHKLVVGSYHFFTIDDNAEPQVRNYISHTQWKKGDLPPVLDIESEFRDHNAYIRKLKAFGVERMQRSALIWLREIEKYYKVKPIIYTSETWRDRFLTDSEFDNYDFWIARYHNVLPSHEWKFWQSTNAGHLNGYIGDIDVNVFNGGYKEFLKYKQLIY